MSVIVLSTICFTLKACFANNVHLQYELYQRTDAVHWVRSTIAETVLCLLYLQVKNLLSKGVTSNKKEKVMQLMLNVCLFWLTKNTFHKRSVLVDQSSRS